MIAKKDVLSILDLVTVCLVSVVLGYVHPAFGALGILGGSFYFINKNKYDDMFLLYLFISLIASSQVRALEFAGLVKPVLMLLLLTLIWFRFSNTISKYGLFQYIFPFIAFSMFLVPQAIEYGTLAKTFQKTVSYGLVFIIIPHLSELVVKTDVKRFLIKLLLFGILLLFVNLIIYRIDPNLFGLKGRLKGLTGNPNEISLFIFCLIMMFQLIKRNFAIKVNWILEITLYAISILVLYRTQSRTAIAGLILFFALLQVNKINPFLSLFVLLLFVAVNELIKDLFTESVQQVGLGSYFRVSTVKTGSGRLIAWGFAWDYLKDNLFIGKGFHYAEVLLGRKADYLRRLGHIGNIHNSYLTLWVETGLIGLILLFFGLGIIIYRAAKRNFLTIPVLFAFFFTAYFESWMAGSLSPYMFSFIFCLTILYYYPYNPKIKKQNLPNEEAQSPAFIY